MKKTKMRKRKRCDGEAGREGTEEEVMIMVIMMITWTRGNRRRGENSEERQGMERR